MAPKKPDLTASYIELQAKEPPLLEHEDYQKCGQCLKNMIRYQVACEFARQGKIGPEYITELEQEVKARWEDTILFKEIAKLRKSGLTLDEAIAVMEKKGYIP
jgi:hypothetical protein